jgi:DNA-binding NtrC family response regulator
MSHVLIVDDDAKVRELIRRFLEPAGYDVIESETAEDAIRSVGEAAPAVAFCDMHMPGANGLWLADQIRAISPATAMVLATGDSGIAPAETLRPGIVAYLVKPLNGERVRAAAAEGVKWSSDARARAGHRKPAGRLGSGTAELFDE